MKVGDKVAVFDGQGNLRRISTIIRETKLYLFVKAPQGEDRYKKSTKRSGGDTYWHWSIELATKEHYDTIKKSNLCFRLKNYEWSNLDLETLEKVYAIVCGMTDTKENKQ